MTRAMLNQGEEAEMTAEFLIGYLLTLNQLTEMRSQVASARNEQERRKSLVRLQNARRRFKVLGSLVFPREA